MPAAGELDGGLRANASFKVTMQVNQRGHEHSLRGGGTWCPRGLGRGGEGLDPVSPIRRSPDGEAVGWVELQQVGEQADVSYNVTAELRGQGIAPRALSVLLAWAASQIGLRRAHLACHADNVASRRVAKKCGFVLVSQDGDEYKFERDLGLLMELYLASYGTASLLIAEPEVTPAWTCLPSRPDDARPVGTARPGAQIIPAGRELLHPDRRIHAPSRIGCRPLHRGR